MAWLQKCSSVRCSRPSTLPLLLLLVVAGFWDAGHTCLVGATEAMGSLEDPHDDAASTWDTVTTAVDAYEENENKPAKLRGRRHLRGVPVSTQKNLAVARSLADTTNATKQVDFPDPSYFTPPGFVSAFLSSEDFSNLSPVDQVLTISSFAFVGPTAYLLNIVFWGALCLAGA